MNDVRRRYRTTSETAVVGEPLAGLFVVETLLLDPLLFRGYIALSPSVWWNGGETVRAAQSHIGALRGAQRVLISQPPTKRRSPRQRRTCRDPEGAVGG